MDTLHELGQFLTLNSRFDVKVLALQQIQGLTANGETCNELTNDKHIDIVKLIIGILNDSEPVVKMCYNILTNITAEKLAASNILKSDTNLIQHLFSTINDPQSEMADKCCKVLNNITASTLLADQVFIYFEDNNLDVNKLVSSFVIQNYNQKHCSLDYLAKVFGNLTQSSKFRRFILDPKTCVIQRLVPFTDCSQPIRKQGITSVIKNCSFDSEHHAWLLSEEVDILPKLLLPLAGGEEFSDEDNDQLPIELQYLPSDKQREGDPEIRKILLETLLQLCSVRSNREYIREKNAYLILRELHKIETNKEVLLACENVVDLLIRTEDEIGVENYQEIEVPSDMTEKFVNMDEDFLKS